MRKQDFRKLVKHVSDKQQAIYDANKLIACNVFIKNDPNECKIHICDDKVVYDFSFFEHDEYEMAKFEIDQIFKILES